MSTLYYLLRSARPRQWVKNLATFAAITFAGQLFLPQKFFPVLFTFFILNLLTSAVYLINDIADIKRDRVHYFKKNRPIAEGLLNTKIALGAALILISVSFFTGYYLSNYLFLVLATFLVIQILYTYYLKHIILLDVITIAATFMLRIFAGFLVVESTQPVTTLSSWLILTTIMLALFLAIGKRRLELTIMSHKIAVEHRNTLSHYPTLLLDGLTFMMASSTILTYSLFTFNEPERSERLITPILPPALSSPKWLMVTIPFVIYGIFRYLYLIYEKKEGESPERVLLQDIPLLVTVISWGLTVLGVIYFIRFS